MWGGVPARRRRAGSLGRPAGRAQRHRADSIVRRVGLRAPAGGEVADFDPAAALSEDERRRLDRIGQFALVAAREALRDADLDLTRSTVRASGVVVGTSLGDMAASARSTSAAGGRHVVRRAPAACDFPYYATATRLARELGVRGPVISPSIACASGTQAVGLALELIRRGQADVFVVGGAEAAVRLRRQRLQLPARDDRPTTVRPFDARRDGLLLGEGAAMLVVESAAHAARAAPVPTSRWPAAASPATRRT